MFLRRFFFVIVLVISAGSAAFAQDEFCEAVNAIIMDAPNQFRNVRGNAMGARGEIWASSIKVPGTISSRFVYAMGLFYEGGFFQSKDISKLRPVYEKYIRLLNECLSQQGYKMTSQPNFNPGLEAYKKQVFMLPERMSSASAGAPSHITLEATYSKTVGYYTLVMYIFEH